MKKRVLSFLLALAMCLSLGTFVLPQQARADGSYGSFDKNKYYFIWLKNEDGTHTYRWNADGLKKRDVIHLDVAHGANCVMSIEEFPGQSDGYYGIRVTDNLYIDADDMDHSTGQTLHQWSDHMATDRDNQMFRFIPVEGEENTYYIQITKDSNLYVGLKDNKAERYTTLKTVDSNHKCKWVVLPSDWAPFDTTQTQIMDTSVPYYLWLKENGGAHNYRWNADGTRQGNCIHLDTRDGGNCRFWIKDTGEAGYYSIMCTQGSMYVEPDEGDGLVNRVLNQWGTEIKRDNQKFRFIPVPGEENTYYIQVKYNGLYVGLNYFEPPEDGKRLVVGDGEFAWKWEVIPTPALEPNTRLPGSKDHVGAPTSGAATFMMNPVGYQSGLSVKNDAQWEGDEVHLWTMGHFCKVTAEYIGTDEHGKVQDAYRIRSYNAFETSTADTSLLSKHFIWDVEAQTMNDGGTIHVWEEGSDSRESCLWRFIPVSGQQDVYYIQNVNSHLYVNLDSKEDKDGNILKQSTEKMAWEIHWLYSDNEPYYSYSVDASGNITDPYEGISPGNWMSRLPDDLSLSQLNIPATHDAASTMFYTSDSNPINEGIGQILAQMLYLDEQLNAGVRAWDIRVSRGDASSSDPAVNSDPCIIHGNDYAICHNRWGGKLNLSEVMNAAKEFLETHPRETVIIDINGQGKGQSIDIVYNAMAQYILPNLTPEQEEAINNGTLTYDDIGPNYPIYVPTKEKLNTSAPTLGDVRGKIVILNHLGVPFHYADPNDTNSERIPEDLSDRDEYLFRAMGPDISPYVDGGSPERRLLKIKNTCVWAQDVYDIGDSGVKMEYVDGVFNDLSNNHQTDTEYALNFASGHDKIDVSKGIYKMLMADEYLNQTSGARRNTGILFCNEIDPILSRRIYMTNFDVNGNALPSRTHVVTFDANGGRWSSASDGCTAVTYDDNGNITAQSQCVNTGDAAKRPATPTRSYHTFRGWFLNNTLYDFSTPITENCTLTAIWQSDSPVGGGGGGAVAASANPVTLPASSSGAVSHGSVKASAANARAGDKVTLTLTPDEGYQVDKLTVTDAKGSVIEVTKNADGTYSFTMPDSRVEIAAVFAEIAAAAAGRFVDVAADAFYAEAVAWAVEHGVTTGTDETHFSPNAPCTRAHMVTFLWRAAGSPEPAGGSTPFRDVQAGSYYEKAVAWAVENGITNGVDESRFAPGDTVTRAQTVAFLFRYAKASAVVSDRFADVPPEAWYAEAVAWAAEKGITQGVDAAHFAPNDDCVRGQIVTFLYRLMAG